MAAWVILSVLIAVCLLRIGAGLPYLQVEVMVTCYTPNIAKSGLAPSTCPSYYFRHSGYQSARQLPLWPQQCSLSLNKLEACSLYRYETALICAELTVRQHPIDNHGGISRGGSTQHPLLHPGTGTARGYSRALEGWEAHSVALSTYQDPRSRVPEQALCMYPSRRVSNCAYSFHR